MAFEIERAKQERLERHNLERETRPKQEWL